MRKLFVYAAREVGIPPYEVKVLVNHALPRSGDVTEAHYYTPSPEHLGKCLEKVTGFLLEKLRGV